MLTKLGQCYPPETLEQLIRFCASKKIHLISDEIYALSTYERQDRASEKFTSVLAIDYSKIIDPRQVHVLYGLSKVRTYYCSLIHKFDCALGLRGCRDAPGLCYF